MPQVTVGGQLTANPHAAPVHAADGLKRKKPNAREQELARYRARRAQLARRFRHRP